MRVTWCRGCRAHLQMLEAGTLGGWTRGVIGADDSLHEVPGQQQAAGLLSGYPRRSLGALSPEQWARRIKYSPRRRVRGGPYLQLQQPVACYKG